MSSTRCVKRESRRPETPLRRRGALEFEFYTALVVCSFTNKRTDVGTCGCHALYAYYSANVGVEVAHGICAEKTQGELIPCSAALLVSAKKFHPIY
jgi:hypothetical protein